MLVQSLRLQNARVHDSVPIKPSAFMDSRAHYTRQYPPQLVYIKSTTLESYNVDFTDPIQRLLTQ